jgi:hypothetical protein
MCHLKTQEIENWASLKEERKKKKKDERIINDVINT